MTTRFICGCASKLEPPISRETFKTFDSIVEDWQGHLVCLVHKERLYGWRSVPYRYVVTASMTPLEYERWIIFGEKPKMKLPDLVFEEGGSGPDNRDPEQVGNEYLAAMAVARNGADAKYSHGGMRTDWPR
jgi:hypothetical protein